MNVCKISCSPYDKIAYSNLNFFDIVYNVNIIFLIPILNDLFTSEHLRIINSNELIFIK